jgi:FkbM family methyltransferase
LSQPDVTRVIALDGVNCIVAGKHGYFLANRYDHYVGLALIKYGEYGELEWQVLGQLAAAGATVVEIGANIGSHSVALAKAVGPTGRLIAIEPQRIIHQHLSATISLNALTNVECHWTGCGAESGELVVPPMDYFAEYPQNFGSVSLVAGGEGERVPVVRLDDLMAGRRTSLIKIDVEGMEAEVLRGAAGVIAVSRPIIYTENDRPAKSDELLSLIWSMNYRTFWHVPRLFNPDNFFGDPENLYADTASFNLLCVPKETPLSISGFPEATRLGQHPLDA